MYNRIFKMPLIVSTILYPLVLFVVIKGADADLNFWEYIFIWPLTVAALVVLRMLTIVNQKARKKGEEIGANLVDHIFKDTNKKS